MDKKYILQIFIAGVAPDVQTKIIELKDLLNSALGENQYDLNVVDVLDKPQMASEERILATPTMVRQEPAPIKKVILNFNKEEVTEADIKSILKD